MEHSRRKSIMLRLAVFAAAVSFAAMMAACGGGDDEPADEPTSAATRAAAASPTAEAAGETTEVTVGEAFWHAGWRVRLGDAVFTPDGASSTVAIDATFDNLGADTATFDSQLVLMSGGENYTEEATEHDLPEVPGNLSGNGTLAFRVDDTFSFEDASLLIGNPMNNQATVPLGEDRSGLVSLEPLAIAVTGPITAGAVVVNVTGAELRADLPDIHSEVEKGSKALIVSFTVTVNPGIQIGQGVFQSQNVALKLPDGTAVAVRSDGRSGVNELLQGKEGTTIPDLSVRFEVPEPYNGQYAFVVRGNYGPGGAMVEGELPFTVTLPAE